jgi:hypothetical protein
MAAWIGAVPKHNHNAWVVTRFIKEPPFLRAARLWWYSFTDTLSAPSSPQIRDTFSYPFSSTTSFDVARK